MTLCSLIKRTVFLGAAALALSNCSKYENMHEKENAIVSTINESYNGKLSFENGGKCYLFSTSPIKGLSNINSELPTKNLYIFIAENEKNTAIIDFGTDMFNPRPTTSSTLNSPDQKYDFTRKKWNTFELFSGENYDEFKLLNEAVAKAYKRLGLGPN